MTSVSTTQLEKPQVTITAQRGTNSDPKPQRTTQHSVPVIVIDVDSEPMETSGGEVVQVSGPSYAKCQGYVLRFPPGKTSYSAYPFALHDSRSLPWDFSIENGVMTLFARNCHGSESGPNVSCPPCLYLPKNKSLEGIVNRLQNASGVHPNSPYSYHGAGGLHEFEYIG
jgi:hypothetical protein